MWPFRKSRNLSDHLCELKTVHIDGIIFKIKKIDLYSRMAGYQSVLCLYDKYENKKKNDLTLTEPSDKDMEKIKHHFRDVFLSGVVKPKLSLKEEDGHICVDEIFRDWELAGNLYQEIIAYTYGKKKPMFAT